MKNIIKKENFVIFMIVIVCSILIFLGNKVAMGKTVFFNEENNLIQEKATVVKVLDEPTKNDELIKFTCKISEGKNKGKVVTAGQIIDPNIDSKTKIVEKEDKIYLGDAKGYNIGTDWFMYDYDRFGGIVWLASAFAILLYCFSRGSE